MFCFNYNTQRLYPLPLFLNFSSYPVQSGQLAFQLLDLTAQAGIIRQQSTPLSAYVIELTHQFLRFGVDVVQLLLQLPGELLRSGLQCIRTGKSFPLNKSEPFL